MLNHYDLGLRVGWFEIPRDFIRLPKLYGFKYGSLITSVIVFVLVLPSDIDLWVGKDMKAYLLCIFC
jgi:hypothetical protein